MKKFIISAILVICFMVLFACGRTEFDSSELETEVTSTVTSTVLTTTTGTSTTTKTTTTAKATTTTTVTTTEPVTTAEVITEPVVYTPVEVYEEPVYEEPVVEDPVLCSDLPITEYERVLLCNVVASEAGSNWISVYNKACVVAVVMNRVGNAKYPNTIEGVLTQPDQFTGYYVSNYYYSTVTEACIEAVSYYFSHQDEFPYYLSFYGDGYQNHFS